MLVREKGWIYRTQAAKVVMKICVLVFLNIYFDYTCQLCVYLLTFV